MLIADDEPVTWYQIDKNKITCRLCKQPARCNITRWTSEGEMARVDCDCGLTEWRPITRAKKK